MVLFLSRVFRVFSSFAQLVIKTYSVGVLFLSTHQLSWETVKSHKNVPDLRCSIVEHKVETIRGDGLQGSLSRLSFDPTFLVFPLLLNSLSRSTSRHRFLS